VLGHFDEARTAAERLNAIDPRVPFSYLMLAETKCFTAGDPQIAAMESLLRDEGRVNAHERIVLHFALGSIYQKMREYGQSFRHFTDGNALMRKQIDYDEKRALGQLADIRNAFTPELIASKSGHGDPSTKPIFIVGMPRSGTTLIEQVLAAHPRVQSCGEIKHFALSLFAIRGMNYPENCIAMTASQMGELGREYLKKVTASIPATAERFTDKLPNNVLYVGLIHLALPNARIIHARRDRIDNCVSCFEQLFSDPLNFSYELGELGRYYRATEQVTAHWRHVLPANTMLEVRYEDMIDDLETQARRIVGYCGLEWNDACLYFHEVERPVTTASAAQVRRPIYRSSVGRWRAYRAQLQPLLDALGMPKPDTTVEKLEDCH
jgi:Sulfotransferase family